MFDLRHALLLFAATFLYSGSAFAEGEAVNGEKIFSKCKACHSIEPDKHRIGPSLYGVVGRPAGTAAGYKYSKAMKAYGESGVVWSEDTLELYLTAPRKVVKGTKMAFPGLKLAEQRADLIAYLKAASEVAE